MNKMPHTAYLKGLFMFLTMISIIFFEFHNVFDAWQVYCQGVEGNAGRAGKEGKAGNNK